MKIEDNKIFIWEEDNCMLGFSRLNLNGIKEDFGAGFKIEGLNGEKEISGLAKNRAIKQVKIQFANIIDAIKMYDKDILDSEGNVDQKKFMEKERAIQRTNAKRDKIDLNEKENFTKLKDLNVFIITEKQADKLGIGNK